MGSAHTGIDDALSPIHSEGVLVISPLQVLRLNNYSPAGHAEFGYLNNT